MAADLKLQQHHIGPGAQDHTPPEEMFLNIDIFVPFPFWELRTLESVHNLQDNAQQTSHMA